MDLLEAARSNLKTGLLSKSTVAWTTVYLPRAAAVARKEGLVLGACGGGGERDGGGGMVDLVARFLW